MNAMNDKFLYQLHEEPDSEFAKNLQQMLFQLAQPPERKSDMNFERLSVTQRAKLAWITVALAVSVLLFVTISPVRAFVSSLITKIAGLTFEITADYPGDNYPDHETTIEPQRLSLTDALAAFPHKVNLPTYLPSRYILNEENVRVYIGEDAGFMADTMELTWLSNDKQINLIITNRDLSIAEIVAPNSVEEISLDANHPAAVIRGGWDVDKKAWITKMGYEIVRLRWLSGDLSYELMGTDLEQLKKVALSILE
jgi:hypothetical protein